MMTIIGNGQYHRDTEEVSPSFRASVITIDGPSGVGKSTAAKLLASRLGFSYLDTGALYRAIAWKVWSEGVDPDNQQSVAGLLSALSLELEPTRDATKIWANGKEITLELREPTVARYASIVSRYPDVRVWLLPVQQEIGRVRRVVAEGRDLGTTVFPYADVKFYMDASVDVRAGRRFRERQGSSQDGDLDETTRAIVERDVRDQSRTHAPLAIPTDACIIDTSALDVDAVVDHMMGVLVAKQ